MVSSYHISFSFYLYFIEGLRGVLTFIATQFLVSSRIIRRQILVNLNMTNVPFAETKRTSQRQLGRSLYMDYS
jgi:hypothetical protein